MKLDINKDEVGEEHEDNHDPQTHFQLHVRPVDGAYHAVALPQLPLGVFGLLKIGTVVLACSS